MDSFKEFYILNEGYGTVKPFNKYKTFEMFATAPENISKAIKILQDTSAVMDSKFNSNLDAKTGIKKGDTTKTPMEAFIYAVDNSNIQNGGQVLQAMAIAHYILSSTKSKVDSAEDKGMANDKFYAKVKLHFAANKSKNDSDEAANEKTEVEMKKIDAKVSNLRSIYNNVLSKGKNISQAFKNAHEIVSGNTYYYNSSDADFSALNKAFAVKEPQEKQIPPELNKKPVENAGEASKEGIAADETKEPEQEKAETPKEPEQAQASQRTEIPFDLNSYKDEVDKIIDSKVEELKKRFNIQEEVLNAIDNTMTEMFRSAHDKEGNETDYYKEKKVLSSEKYIKKQLEDIRNKAHKKLEELFGVYNDKIITKNKKASIKIKILNTIPQVKIETTEASHKMFKSLTQNEVGLSVKAAGQDVSRLASNIKNKVKGSATFQKAKDAAGTAAENMKNAASTAGEKMKDAKETFDKNVKDAKDVHAQGGDAGIVGKTEDIRKAVNDRLKNVFFGRKQAAQARAQQATQPQQPVQPVAQPVAPVQAALPSPNQVAINLPDNSKQQLGLPTPEQVAKTQQEKQDEIKRKAQGFKPKLKDDEEEEKKGTASVDTDKKKIKNTLNAMKKKLR